MGLEFSRSGKGLFEFPGVTRQRKEEEARQAEQQALQRRFGDAFTRQLQQGVSPQRALMSVFSDPEIGPAVIANQKAMEQIKRTLETLASGRDPDRDVDLQNFKLPDGNIEVVDTNDTERIADVISRGGSITGDAPQASPAFGEERFAQEKALRREGKTDLQVNFPEIPKSLTKGDEQLLKGGEEAALLSREMIPRFELVEKAARRVKAQGPGARTVLSFKRFASMIGVANAEDLPAAELLNAVGTELATRMRLPGSGQMSDREFDIYLRAAPGLAQSQAGNLILANVGLRLAKRRLEEFERLKKFILETGSSVDFQRDERPILSEEEFDILTETALTASVNTAPSQTLSARIDAFVSGGLPTNTEPAEGAQPQAGFQVGDTQEGRGGTLWRFRGGDPTKQENWEQVR